MSLSGAFAAAANGFHAWNPLRNGQNVASPISRGDRNLITEARRASESLVSTSDSELIQRCHQLRNSQDDERRLVEATALVLETVKRQYAIGLYDVQLLAGIVMSRGHVAEMQTGEGKTFTGILPTFLAALAGRGVHVCTPNAYLAIRDEHQLRPIFQRLGMVTATRLEADSFEQSCNAYAADITYAAGQQFGFDYLHDQWTRRQFQIAELGRSTTQQLRGVGMETRLRGRGLYAAVIDEADHVLVDDATSPLLISTAGDQPAPDAELHLAARPIALALMPNQHFREDEMTGAVTLTDQGYQEIYDDEDLATDSRLSRAWHEYVLVALRAERSLSRERHYIVRDDEIRLVEQSTGRIFPDRTWSGGLHQAVQAKEGLTITAETQSRGRIARQSFFRSYQHLCGMTGTGTPCRSELKSIYGLDVRPIPTRLPCRRQVLELGVCRSYQDKLRAVTAETLEMVASQRAVLIGTNHIDQSLDVARALRIAGQEAKVLNGLQTEDEAEIVSLAGRCGAVTVATHVAGRGTDIPLDTTVHTNGGLHVIALEHHRLSRVDRQLVGRGARQGDPGSARFYISPDDRFVSDNAPHLAATVIRCLDSGEPVAALSSNIELTQRRLEQEDRRLRYRQMKRNDRPGKMLQGIGAGVSKSNQNRRQRGVAGQRDVTRLR
ncbi:MAG: preprotein translocase subunit SecA [Planctomycetota bacterium]